MAEKDIAEKILEAYSDVFADIVNVLLFQGRQFVKEDELEEALNGAEYLLCKRSGFVDSAGYAKEQQRKRDLYVLKAGACVGMKFQGDVYDVSGKNGAHPVYRYAKPMFLEVDA